MPVGYTVRQLAAEDLKSLDALLHTFGEAFNELETYTGKPPSADYKSRLLDTPAVGGYLNTDGSGI